MKKKEEFLYLGLHFSLSTAADNCGAPRRRLYLYAPDVKRSLDQKCFRSTDNEAPKKSRTVQRSCYSLIVLKSSAG